MLDYYRQYKQNKSRCGRRSTVLSDEQSTYVQEKVAQGWSPDVIIGRGEFPIDCSVRTLYRMFKRPFDTQSLPMKGNVNRIIIKKSVENRPFAERFMNGTVSIHT